MNTEVYLGIAIRIIVLCALGMIGTYIPEHLRDFFGDKLLGPEVTFKTSPDEDWEWGARHIWYFWGMTLLFVLSLINVVVGCIKLINKHYKL